MEAVHKSGLEKVADHGWSSAYPNILAVCGFLCALQRINRGGREEVERGASSHLDGRPRRVRQDEDRAVKWRLVAPPPFPIRITWKVVQPELTGPHDLGANVGEVILCILVVHAGGAFAAGVLEHALLERPCGDIGTDQA